MHLRGPSDGCLKAVSERFPRLPKHPSSIRGFKQKSPCPILWLCQYFGTFPRDKYKRLGFDRFRLPFLPWALPAHPVPCCLGASEGPVVSQVCLL